MKMYCRKSKTQNFVYKYFLHVLTIERSFFKKYLIRLIDETCIFSSLEVKNLSYGILFDSH